MGSLYSSTSSQIQTNTQSQANIQNQTNTPSLKKLVWIDLEINSEENLRYQDYLWELLFEVYTFDDIDEGICQLKQFKFEKIYIIISGMLFENFIQLIKKNLQKFHVF